MKVLEPILCSLCRMQRRLGYRKERYLFRRKCDFTGKEIISQFPVDTPFPVYGNDVWWSDAWNPLKFGRSLDFSRPFFEQFFELRDTIPRSALQQQRPMENSEYCNCASLNKNCYLVFSTNHSEDCSYGSWVNYSKNCIDNLSIDRCELCYECIGCKNCYNLRYCRDSYGCRDSFFLRNCTECRNCFGCSNQIHKEYMVLNEQKTKEEYEKFLKSVHTGSSREMSVAKKRIDGVLKDLIVKEFHGLSVYSSTGDYLNNCKNCFLCYECTNSEDLRYSVCLQSSKNSMDYNYWGQNAEWIYECHACGYDVYNLRFCNLCWSGSHDLTYSDHCFSTKNCFGCVGLKREEYCILNKKYSKKEYEEIIPKIIEHMKQTGEWGEFFPVEMSPFAYNETVAQEYFPMTKEEVLQKGWKWKEEEKFDASGIMKKIPASKLPDSITDIPDDILNCAIECEESGKRFKIQKAELEFYRKMNLPIPHFHPDIRHAHRMALRNPRKLWNRNCAKCQKEIQTTYSPERPEIVYCEECYLKEVY